MLEAFSWHTGRCCTRKDTPCTRGFLVSRLSGQTQTKCLTVEKKKEKSHRLCVQKVVASWWSLVLLITGRFSLWLREVFPFCGRIGLSKKAWKRLLEQAWSCPWNQWWCLGSRKLGLKPQSNYRLLPWNVWLHWSWIMDGQWNIHVTLTIPVLQPWRRRVPSSFCPCNVAAWIFKRYGWRDFCYYHLRQSLWDWITR